MGMTDLIYQALPQKRAGYPKLVIFMFNFLRYLSFAIKIQLAYANHEGVFELKKAEHENIKASIF